MASAIQTIAERFEPPEAAAQHFGHAPTWLGQATAAANLSEKVTALLDSGKIASTGAAVQLERQAKKSEARAEALIDQIEQLPEEEKASKKVGDDALFEASGRSKKEQETLQGAPVVMAAPIADSRPEASDTRPPWEEAPVHQGVSAYGSPRTKVNPSKVKRVAELLGLSEENEEDLLVRLPCPLPKGTKQKRSSDGPTQVKRQSRRSRKATGCEQNNPMAQNAKTRYRVNC